jgi:hypothetical protein
VSVYLVAGAVISLIAVALLRETRHERLAL